MQHIIEKISRSLTELVEEKSSKPQGVWIKRYQVEEDFTKNQFLAFLKPEATAVLDKVNVAGILQFVFNTLQRYNIEVRAVRILTGGYLQQYRIMDNHYGIINSISRRGPDAISVDAREALEKTFESDLHSGGKILGGHQFLERYPQFSPLVLSTISDNIGPKKLASGTYCLRLVLNDKILLILNAFHPYQLEKFTKRGTAIVILEAVSSTAWRIVRQQLVGATDPFKAAEGSLRHTFLKQRNEFGLSAVNLSNNGIHLSAGPLEGAIEVRNFFSEYEKGIKLSFQETCFGRLILSKGLHQKSLTELMTNPTFKVCERVVSSFDLTEEIDSEAAAEKLIEMYES
jgi:Nucleoside diphosphate kinase